MIPRSGTKLKTRLPAELQCELAECGSSPADLSEQISPAGWTGLGPGNMKPPLNSALTIRTLDWRQCRGCAPMFGPENISESSAWTSQEVAGAGRDGGFLRKLRRLERSTRLARGRSTR